MCHRPEKSDIVYTSVSSFCKTVRSCKEKIELLLLASEDKSHMLKRQ